MKNEINVLTHLFYFMPQSITFRSKDDFIKQLNEQTKNSIYSAFDINTISDCFPEFLKVMKNHISAKRTVRGYIIEKADSFKSVAETDCNAWSSKYKTLLTKLAKNVMVSAVSYAEKAKSVPLNDPQKIRIVAEFYKKVDTQVSEWLFELAKMKE